ncbi:MAG: cupin domain-containing protein [Eubacteriales bacterium]|nr:cupin domain-containing protein [Eubacteriales bacterium]
MRDSILITRRENVEPIHKAERPPYEYLKYEVTPRKDFDQCCVAVYEIPPGKAGYPYHCHLANTEVFYVLEGEGRLETPEGTRAVKKGDFIACPPGENGAHRLFNASQAEPLIYIDFDTANSPDIVHYPDSKKVGIIARGMESKFFQMRDEADYYDGE